MALNESVYIKILGLIAALVAIYAVIAVRDAGNGVGLVDIILDCSITLIVIFMILLKSKGILKLEILALALFILNTFDLTYNAYDAMNSSRCYRKALDLEIIMGEIEKGKGHQFDPKLAEIFLSLADTIDYARQHPATMYDKYSFLSKNIDLKIASESAI